MSRFTFAVVLAAVLTGCVASPPAEVTSMISPADPVTPIEGNAYRPVLTGYTHREPTDPKPWRQLNEDLGAGEGS